MLPESPRASYRLQFGPGFGFAEAARLAPYLAKLGVSHLYASPLLQAVRGSAHGYDVTDPSKVNSQLGGAEGLAGLFGALQKHGLSLLLDIVPNHMAVSPEENPWWRDLLRLGRASRYAGSFDLDWGGPEGLWRDKLFLPLLPKPYGACLKEGLLKAEAKEGELVLLAAGSCYPLSPASLQRLPQELKGPEEQAAWLNGDPLRLDAFLLRQHYLLAGHRAAAHDLGYRRFFDINGLAGIRVERAEVFRELHALPLLWLRQGWIQGLRIDHPDGLKDPAAYFQKLRAEAGGAWIVAEKILAPQERMPSDWPVDGSTGYAFLNLSTRILVDPAGEAEFEALYREFSGETRDYAALKRDCRLYALQELLGAELNRLARHCCLAAQAQPGQRDLGRDEFKGALAELAAQFPVYRSYLKPGSGGPSPAEKAAVEAALEAALEARKDLEAPLRFLASLLLSTRRGRHESELVLRFQQLCAPAMAKGVEDTLFFRYSRYLALNEVGGEPSSFGAAPREFHASCMAWQANEPLGLLPLATHDSKLSGDARARLCLLSEMPSSWAAALRRWKFMLASLRQEGPWDGALELYFYQALFASWPISKERLEACMLKAARESKTLSSWQKPDKDFEKRWLDWVGKALRQESFIRELEAMLENLAWPAVLNSLAQVVLCLAAPGVPDFYQGSELWQRSLADPDNRAAVDFGARIRALEGLEGASPELALAGAGEGLPKLWLIQKGLKLRERRPEALGPKSSYSPLQASGAKASHVLAFSRGGLMLAVAPRLVLGLQGGWEGTQLELPKGSFVNVLDGARHGGGAVSMDELCARFPVALLEKEA